jgi:hypothetical protein
MEYNTTRSKMLMPEYGRNVQRMVEFLLTIDDRAKRLKNAEAIVELMGALNPHLKNMEDYKHKLWDHLYQMTDFTLDVDGPYPMPSREEVMKKPEMIPYPKENGRNRHFGKNLTQLIEKALKEENPEKRQGFTQIIGYYMKLAYTNWHKEPVHDDMIKSELYELSGGQLKYESGGYKVHFDNRNFKQNRNNNNNNNNRNRNNGNRNFGNGSGYNKNRKFKNKQK